jgi:hypothetical protein
MLGGLDEPDRDARYREKNREEAMLEPTNAKPR